MKRAIVSLILAGFMVLALSPLAFAGLNSNAKIQLHVGPKVAKAICEGGWKTCNSIVTAGGLYPPNVYYTYLIVTDYDVAGGIAGGQCGIAYTGGVKVFGWVFCAALQFQNDPPNPWPSSGGGNLWTWDASSTDPLGGCQKLHGISNVPTAVAGYFYMGAYTPGTMSVTKRPADNRAKVASCANVEENVCGGGDLVAPCDGVSHLGSAAFNTSQTGGYNPCGLVTAVQPSTWGGIKAIYH